MKKIFAGVQPYMIREDGEILLLLATERGRGYCTFGGKPESGDLYKEALREFEEETHALFAHLNYLPDTIPCVETKKVIIFPLFLFPEAYEIIRGYNNITSYLRNKGLHQYSGEGLFEKIHMKWFTLSELETGEMEDPIFPYFANEIPLLSNYFRQKYKKVL